MTTQGNGVRPDMVPASLRTPRLPPRRRPRPMATILHHWIDNPPIAGDTADLAVGNAALPNGPEMSVATFFPSFTASKTIRVVAIFAGGNLVGSALLGIGTIVQARFVGPEVMGIFQTFTMIMGYLAFLHMGVFDGLQRELPLRLGRGDQQGAERASAACLSWIVMASGACGVAFVALAVLAMVRGDWISVSGWGASIVVVASTLYGGYLMATYRTTHHFVQLSTINMVKGVVSTLALAPLPWLHFYGVCFRAAVGSLIHTVALHRERPLPVRPKFIWADFWAVIRVGLPFGLIGYVATGFWPSLEGSFVLGAAGRTGLGLFAIVFLARQTMSGLIASLTQVYQPRVTAEWGRNGQIARCIRMCVLPTVASTLVALPLVAVAWVCVAPAVRHLIPDYVDAIPAFQWACLVMLTTALRLPLNVALAMGDIAGFGLVIGAGLAVFSLAAVVAIVHGGGLVEIVNASNLGSLTQVLTTYAWLFFRLRRSTTSMGSGT